MLHHDLKWYNVLWEDEEEERHCFLLAFTLDHKPIINDRSRSVIPLIKNAVDNQRYVDFEEPKVSQVLFLNGEYIQ